MYTVEMNGTTILDARKNILIDEPVLELTDNEAGSFTFTMYSNNPGAGDMAISNEVTVKWDNEILFVGRIVEVQRDMTGALQVECEGDLAYLDDTVLPPFGEEREYTVEDLVDIVLLGHNTMSPDKAIQKGTVAVQGTLAVEFDWSTSLSSLKSLLIDQFGGHIRIRHEDGKRLLDYYDYYPGLSGQSIHFGENLLGFTQSLTTRDIATAVVPIGKDGLLLSGQDYIVSKSAVEKYGLIYKAVKFDDIEDETALREAGEKWLAQNQEATVTCEVSAVDLADFGLAADHLRLLDVVHAYSEVHGLSIDLAISKVSLNLLDPSASTYTLGSIPKTLSRQVKHVETGPSDPNPDASGGGSSSGGSGGKDYSQDIKDLKSKNTEQDGKIDDLAKIDEQQNKIMEELVSRDTEQNNRLDGIDTKNTEQDERLAALEARPSGGSMGPGHVWIQPSLQEPNNFYITQPAALNAGAQWLWNQDGMAFTNGVNVETMFDKNNDADLHGAFYSAIQQKQQGMSYMNQWDARLGTGEITSNFIRDVSKEGVIGDRHIKIDGGQISGWCTAQTMNGYKFTEELPDRYGNIQFTIDNDTSYDDGVPHPCIKLSSEAITLEATKLYIRDPNGTMPYESKGLGLTAQVPFVSSLGKDDLGKYYVLGQIRVVNGIVCNIYNKVGNVVYYE